MLRELIYKIMDNLQNILLINLQSTDLCDDLYHRLLFFY